MQKDSISIIEKTLSVKSIEEFSIMFCNIPKGFDKHILAPP